MKNLIKFLFFVLLVSAGISVLYDHRLKTDRKSTRLNSSHSQISYAVFCLKKKKIHGLNECSGLTIVHHWTNLSAPRLRDATNSRYIRSTSQSPRPVCACVPP